MGVERERESRGIYVEIAAPMGTGKTSLAKLFNQRAGFHTILEQEEDLKRVFFLEPFLSNPTKYGFEGNLNFLAFHLNRIQERLHDLPEKSKVISDASVVTQYAYASWLPSDEQETVSRIIAHSYKKLPKVDLWIVPHLPIDLHMERIRNRGRENEKEVSREFLIATQEKIQEAIEKFGGSSPVLYLDASKLDWVNSEKDKKKVILLAEKKLG